MRRYLLAIMLLSHGHPALAGQVKGYALVVGSNLAGPGQKPLRFAHNDARQVQQVLTQLGGYRQDKTWLLLDPDPAALLRALAGVRERLQQHVRRDERSVFVFYYSGHARARALNMGPRELPLSQLRGLLVDLPSTVTVAILDACQTGAISRIKGAEPTADFSYNSVTDLNSAGLAVMASSSANELSQEADRLRGSYFTHNLVVGLRGAADADHDGGVTLSEAYRYAYNRTLVATASTAVGKQHVTLETKLRGKGEMVLTKPARANSALRLPAPLSAELLVQRQPGQSVVAELSKAPGDSVRLALPAGRYTTIVRTGRRVLQCELSLSQGRESSLRLDRCTPATPEQIGVKGQSGPWREQWGLELGVGGLWSRHDDFTRTLDNFGFEEQWALFDTSVTFQASLSHSLTRHLSLVVGWNRLDGGTYEREVHGSDGQRYQTFDWSAHAIGLYARGTLPLVRGILNPYIQAGGGPAWGSTRYSDPLQASEVLDDELQWGYHLAVAGGMHVMPFRFAGVYVQGAYLYAPVVKNLVQDTHDSGGFALYLGVRGAL